MKESVLHKLGLSTVPQKRGDGRKFLGMEVFSQGGQRQEEIRTEESSVGN